MKIGPGFFGSLFTGSGGWELGFDAQFVKYKKGGESQKCIALDDVTHAVSVPGAIWAEIKVSGAEQIIACDGIVNDEAKDFVTALRSSVGGALLKNIEEHESELKKIAESLQQFLARPQYLANRDIYVWRSTVAANDRASLSYVLEIMSNPLLPKEGATGDIRKYIDFITDVLSGSRKQIKSHNKQFVSNEIARHKTFFDSVEKTPLTSEQRIASVVMEDRNLLVAAAGSGKTSTVVGKIGYALITKQYEPSDFLVLAFNNDAAKELDARLNEQLKALLPEDQRIKAKTFHAFGLEIMAEAEGKKPSIANFAGGGETADSLIMDQLIKECLKSDQAFASDWVTFRAVCYKSAKNPAEFKSLGEWEEYVREKGEYQNGKRGFLTIQGEIVKSQGELAIANWLYMNGVAYEYERPYEYDTADRQYRQYRPDFYFPSIKTYLEHYALDKKGHPPIAFGHRYAESMKWKAQLHEEKATALITTTFADFISGDLYPKLEIELRNRGQILAPRPLEEILARLNDFQKTDYVSFLRMFLKHAKSNEVNEEILLARVESNPQPFRALLFVRVFWKIMTAYQDRLRKNSEIDFEDMIIGAANHIATRRYKHSYKLILVDEFQDISQARAKLLKVLLAQAPDCKLFAVGDDWQSIYRFAGSDISLFTHFAKHFGVTATNYLTQTFRSNQGITDTAADFVQQNPEQMRKRVKALNPTVDGVVSVRRYGKLEEMVGECKACLEEIAKCIPPGERVTVFLLGRYRHQKPLTLDEWKAEFGSLDIAYKTAHSSKGLQADYVIVLGLHTGRYAFPSEISDDPLLHLVMPQAEEYPHAEERRLFYVAMTRARHRVYLLGGNYTPSAFLTEILKDTGNGHEDTNKDDEPENEPDRKSIIGKASTRPETCPRCGNGRLSKRNGRYGEFIGCSNFPSCRYTRNVNVMANTKN